MIMGMLSTPPPVHSEPARQNAAAGTTLVGLRRVVLRRARRP